MSKHTKGPWKYQEESDAYTHIVRAKNNYTICHLLQDSSGTTEANARLISVAPDMLQLLKYIRDWVEEERESFQYSEEIKQLIAEGEPK